MTVHHHRPNHHVAALSGIALANGGNGLNLSRMSANLEAHHHHHRGLEGLVERNGAAAAAAAAAALGLDRLTNGLDARNGNNSHIGLGINIHSSNGSSNINNNNGLDRGDASTTMPHRSRFMITDILAGASSPSSLQSHEPPSSPPSTPRDLSVRHQSRSSLNNSTVDEDSDASHHDTVSVSSNGKLTIFCFVYSLRLPNNRCCVRNRFHPPNT